MGTKELYQLFIKAKEKRSLKENLWRECYEFTMPNSVIGGEKVSDRLFDGTAPDCVDQLAASLLSELTPTWTKWFDLTVQNASDEHFNSELEMISNILSSHFNYSNFTVEIHQCFLDLITMGTACLLFEQNKIGAQSAFNFTAIPLFEVYLEQGLTGRLDTVFRQTQMTISEIQYRFGEVNLPIKEKSEDEKISVIEALIPQMKTGYEYTVFIDSQNSQLFEKESFPILKRGYFEQSPFIVFRWQKLPKEVYGRSPVMKALPDIKTVNKVVELILKNATIAVTGIWQAEDDGVLNPSNIKLIPGTIIPKAVGSKGLIPLEAAGNFDVSQIVLNDLRSRIQHSLLADKLGKIYDNKMTATEVLTRNTEMARILGAVYSRLQIELLNPLIERALLILKNRGLIPQIICENHVIDINFKSPLVHGQTQTEANQMINFLNCLNAIEPEMTTFLNSKDIVQYLAQKMNIPLRLFKDWR